MPKVQLYRDVVEGTARMREQAAVHLPQFPLEDEGRFGRRVRQTVLHNATRMTRDALVGLAFLRDPELAADLPAEILQDAENVDLAGNHLVVFLRQVFEDAFDGVAAILVDMQRAGDDIKTLDDERRAGLRPYAVGICASDILRARTTTIDGVERLSRFAYMESAAVDDGEFGETTTNRVRDYRLVQDGKTRSVLCTVYVQTAADKPGAPSGWSRDGDPVKMTIDEIPVVDLYTGRKRGALAADPPLLDLAYENIDHFQQRSEHRVSFQYARVPIPVFPGMQADRIAIAPDRGICTDAPDQKPYWMEYSGAAIQQSREELRDGERRMAAHGASMLLRSEGAPVTATERRIEDAQSSSRLGVAVRALMDAAEEMLRLFAKWRGLDMPAKTSPDARWMTFHRDFERFEMDAQQVSALDNAVANQHLTLETFLTALKAGLPPLRMLDVDREAELLRQGRPALPAADDPALDAT